MIPSLRIRFNRWIGIHHFYFCIGIDQLTPQKIEHIIEFDEITKVNPLGPPSSILPFMKIVYTKEKRNNPQKIIKSNKPTYND